MLREFHGEGFWVELWVTFYATGWKCVFCIRSLAPSSR